MPTLNGPYLRTRRVADGVLGYSQIMGDYDQSILLSWVRIQYEVFFQPGTYIVMNDDGNLYGPFDQTDFDAQYTIVSVVSPLPQISSPAASTRATNSAFQPSASRATLLSYSVRITSTLTLAGGALGNVELLVGPTAVSLASVGQRVAGGLTGTLVIGVSLTDVKEGTLTAVLPAGWYAEIATTAETGTPTFAITRQAEQEL